MTKAYSVIDIKITEKKNMFGEIFDVDSLFPDELERYIDCLVMFEGKKYWISTIEHIVSIKRKSRTYKGRKVIAELNDIYDQQKQDEEFECMAEERIQYQEASKF